MPSLKDFMEAMSTGWPVAVAILVAAVLIVGADQYQVQYVAGLPRVFFAAVFIVGICAFAVCVSKLVVAIVGIPKWFRRRRLQRERRDREIAWLHDLPNDEGYVMAWLFTSNTQAFSTSFGHKLLVGLIQKGLVLQMSGAHSVLDWPHMIPDHIWAEMGRNRELFTVDVRAHQNPFRLY